MNYEQVMEDRAGRDWEDGDDRALWQAGYDAGHAEIGARLQQALDECARKIYRIHDWAEQTTADRGSQGFGYKEGKFDQALELAYFVIGVAHSAGVTLDATRLDRATERGDFI